MISNNSWRTTSCALLPAKQPHNTRFLHQMKRAIKWILVSGDWGFYVCDMPQQLWNIWWLILIIILVWYVSILSLKTQILTFIASFLNKEKCTSSKNEKSITKLPRRKYISSGYPGPIQKHSNGSKSLLVAFFAFLIPCIIPATSMVSLLSQNEGLGSNVLWMVNKAG